MFTEDTTQGGTKHAVQLPWTDKQAELLLKCVLSNAGHLCDGTKKVKSTWCKIVDEFFIQPEMIPYRQAHYKVGEFRKLRDKYKQVLNACIHSKFSGNTSSKSGDLNNVFLQRYCLQQSGNSASATCGDMHCHRRQQSQFRRQLVKQLTCH